MIGISTQAYFDAASAAISPQRPLLESIREINARFLCALHAATLANNYYMKPELGAITDLFGSVNPAAIQSASRFPFLLMDLGLSQAESLVTLRTGRKGIQEPHSNLCPAEHLAIARSALVIGWHFAR